MYTKEKEEEEMKKLTASLLSAALVASLAISVSAFASGTGDPADTVWDYPYYKTTATAASEAGASNKEGPASFAVDGDSSSYWHSRWGDSGSGDRDLTNLADKRYIQLELEEAVEVAGLRYLPRPSTGDEWDSNGIVTGYRVEVSTTGQDGSWTQVASGTWPNSDRNWKVATFANPTQAKYVRLYGDATAGESSNKFMSCGELRVQTTQKPAENIFSGKTASASSSLPDQGADKANDENGGTKWCANWIGHSSSDYAMEDNWWQVDLGSDHHVDTLTLLFETSAQWKYHVAVSDDPTFGGYTIPVGEIATVTASKAVVNVNQDGRYVRVYLKSDTTGRWPCLWDVYATGNSIDLTPDLLATVTVNTATGGTASANVTNAAPGTEVTLTAQAAQGYHFKEWQVQDGTVTITENKFTMPQGNVTITPVFEEHTYGQPTFAWNQDNTSVTATFTCDREGCGHQETATAQVTSRVTKQPTCTEKGETTYTATVEFGEEIYTDTKDVTDIPATGHHVTLVEGKAPTCTEAGTKAYYVCGDCDAAFEDAEATRTIENLDEWKVIPATGHHFENGVCTVCDAKDADYVPPTGDENQLLAVATVLLTSMGVFAAVMFVEHKRRNS